MKNKKLLRNYYISKALLYFTFSSFILYIIYLVFPFKVFTILTDPPQVITKRVKAGEIFQYTFHRIKHLPLPTEISYTFENGSRYNFPYIVRINAPIGEVSKPVNIEVPKIPADTYRLKVLTRIEFPLFKVQYFEFKTEEFEVYE